MPSPPLRSPWPRSQMSQVYDVIVSSLRNDPTLKHTVDTWQVWDGSADSLVEPSDEDMPFVRIEPEAGPSSWLDENAHQFRWPLKITLGISGTDVRILIDFWDCIRAALFTGNTVLNALYPLNVIQKTLTSPATRPVLWDDAAGILGTCSLSILMRLNT